MVVVGPASHMEPKSPSASASSCSPSRSSSVVEMRMGLGEGRDMSVAIGTGSPVRRSRFRESRLRSARVRLRGASADVPDAGGAGAMGTVLASRTTRRCRIAGGGACAAAGAGSASVAGSGWGCASGAWATGGTSSPRKADANASLEYAWALMAGGGAIVSGEVIDTANRASQVSTAVASGIGGAATGICGRLGGSEGGVVWCERRGWSR